MPKSCSWTSRRGAVNLLSGYETRGANPLIRSAAANALPVVEQHLAMVRQMERTRPMPASRRRHGRSAADLFEKRGQHRQILGMLPLPDEPFFSRLRQRSALPGRGLSLR